MSAPVPILHYAACSIDLDNAEVERGGARESLSPTEVKLLRYLGQRLGRNVTLEELLREVWGYRATRETRAVALTVSRLRRKIEADPANPEVLVNVPRAGYRLSLPQAGEVMDPLEGLLLLVEAPLSAARAAQLSRALGGLPALAEGADPERAARVLVGVARYAFMGAVCLEPLLLWRAAARQVAPAPRLRCVIMAARLSWRSGAVRETLASVERELQVWAAREALDLGDVELQLLVAELRMVRATLLGLCGLGEAAWSEAEWVLGVARGLGSRSLEALALDRMCWSLIQGAEADQRRATHLLLDVEDLLVRGVEPWVRARVGHNLGACWYHLGRAQPAIATLRRAIDDLEQLGAESDAAQARCSLASCLLSQGQAREAHQFALVAVDTQRRMGLRSTEATARVVLGRALASLDRLQEAADELDRAAHIARSTAEPYPLAVAQLDQGLVLWRMGRLAEARPLAELAAAVLCGGAPLRAATATVLLHRLGAGPVSAERLLAAEAQLRSAMVGDGGTHAAVWTGLYWLLEPAPRRSPHWSPLDSLTVALAR